MNRYDRILANTFLVLAFSFLAFLLCESLSRVLLPHQTPAGDVVSYDLEKKPMPYTMFGGRTDVPGVNELGYKGKRPSKAKDPSSYRIFVLGGSTVYNGPPTLPELLEQIFHTKGHRNVEVFNYGIPSSKSGEELARLLFEVVDYQPDAVIMYDGANDLDDPCGDPRPGYPFNFLVYEKNPIMEKDVALYPTFTLLAYGSNLLRYLFKPYFTERFLGINELQLQTNYHGLEWAEKAAENYARNVEKAHHLSKAFGFSLFVFFQPLKTFQTYFKKTGRTSLGEDYHYTTDHVLWGREQFLKRMRESRVKELHFTDLSNIFNQMGPEVYQDRDNVHIKGNYNEVIAEAIYQKVEAVEFSVKNKAKLLSKN